MVPGRVWVFLSMAAALLAAVAGAAGVFLPGTYARETRSWAAQAIGQDAANLFCVLPATLVSAWLALRGSVRAALVWTGLLLYLVYSYVLYAFFIHFGPWFPLYVAVLGMSSYAFFGAILEANRAAVSRTLGGNPGTRLASVLLISLGLLFGAQWLSEIAPALLSGRDPAGIAEIGTPVNPVHVLDLGLLLPGMIAAGLSMRKGAPVALLFAAPLLTFSTAMGLAILFMFHAQSARGETVPAAPVVVMGAVVLASAYGAYRFLRAVGR